MKRVSVLFGLVFELISPIEEGKTVIELTEPINGDDYNCINYLLHRISLMCVRCGDGLYIVDETGLHYFFWPDKKDSKVSFVEKQERLAGAILRLIGRSNPGLLTKYCKQIKKIIFERSKYEGGRTSCPRQFCRDVAPEELVQLRDIAKSMYEKMPNIVRSIFLGVDMPEAMRVLPIERGYLKGGVWNLDSAYSSLLEMRGCDSCSIGELLCSFSHFPGKKLDLAIKDVLVELIQENPSKGEGH